MFSYPIPFPSLYSGQSQLLGFCQHFYIAYEKFAASFPTRSDFVRVAVEANHLQSHGNNRADQQPA